MAVDDRLGLVLEGAGRESRPDGAARHGHTATPSSCWPSSSNTATASRSSSAFSASTRRDNHHRRAGARS